MGGHQEPTFSNVFIMNATKPVACISLKIHGEYNSAGSFSHEIYEKRRSYQIYLVVARNAETIDLSFRTKE